MMRGEKIKWRRAFKTPCGCLCHCGRGTLQQQPDPELRLFRTGSALVSDSIGDDLPIWQRRKSVFLAPVDANIIVPSSAGEWREEICPVSRYQAPFFYCPTVDALPEDKVLHWGISINLTNGGGDHLCCLIVLQRGFLSFFSFFFFFAEFESLEPYISHPLATGSLYHSHLCGCQ